MELSFFSAFHEAFRHHKEYFSLQSFRSLFVSTCAGGQSDKSLLVSRHSILSLVMTWQDEHAGEALSAKIFAVKSQIHWYYQVTKFVFARDHDSHQATLDVGAVLVEDRVHLRVAHVLVYTRVRSVKVDSTRQYDGGG